MQLIDTHCHIHESEFYQDNRERVYKNALAADVWMICASTGVRASKEALEFCATHEQCFPLVGIHPHDAEREDLEAIGALLKEHRKQIYGIGEIGLDYYYMNSSRDSQIATFEQQLQWASDNGLPVSFHVRDKKEMNGDVWEDFWPIIDNFHGISGVLHSFSDTWQQLEKGTGRGLFVGVNGISTFTKDSAQQRMYASIPLEKLLLETDAPFLTPAPFRGNMNEPSFVGRVADHVATVRNLSVHDVAATTTANARALFII